MPTIANSNAATKQEIRALTHGSNVVTVGTKGQYGSLKEAVIAVLAKTQFVETTGLTGTVEVAVNSNVVVGTGTNFDKITEGTFIEFNDDGKYYPVFKVTDELKLFMYVGVPTAVSALSTYKIYTRVDHVIKVLDDEDHSEAVDIQTLSGGSPVSLSIIGERRKTKSTWNNGSVVPRIVTPHQGYFLMENISITARVTGEEIPDTQPLLGQVSPTNQELLYLELNNVELNAEVNTTYFGTPLGVSTVLSANVAAFVSNRLIIRCNELTGTAANVTCDYALVNAPEVYITGGTFHRGMLISTYGDHLLNHPVLVSNPVGRAFPDAAGNPVAKGLYTIDAKSSITTPKQAAFTNPFIVYEDGVSGAGIRFESEFLGRSFGSVTGGYIKTNGTGGTSQQEHGDIIADHSFVRVAGTVTDGDARAKGVAGGIITFTSDVQEVKTSAYTMNSDDEVIVCDGTFTVGLPSAPDCHGKRYTVKNIGTGVITVGITPTPNFTTDATIDGASTFLLDTQWSAVTVAQYYKPYTTPEDPSYINWVIVSKV